ncbi:MAG: hypothetical protein LBM93_00360 [Oscillospiraceae bacterium]|jgi:5-methylcytosine-specific restriction endonuclease McrBC regulatory subunit McrC|nr:hypothetical protein [Oscillospiraceae bacterium]
MKIVKIKDNSKYSENEFSEIPKITDKILNYTLGFLENDLFIFPEMLKNSEDIIKKQKILETRNDNIHSTNIMGFIGCENERLTIKSRFSNGENDWFFQYLLESVLNLPNVLKLNNEYNQDNNSLDLLMFLFPYYLKTAMRKGVFKTYIKNQYNDMNIKGIIDIPRHINKNIPFIGNVAYNKREFSYDNYITELIRHTIEFIKKEKYGQILLRQVKDEVEIVVNSTNNYQFFDRKNFLIENKKNPLRHAYYHEYRTLQRLCIMILQYEKHQIGYGNREINGILFDGAWLWEEYINLLLKDNFYHPKNKSKEGKQYLFNSTGEIYPDFISKNPENRIIADAKYKPKENIANKDYLQVLAYMFRFDAKTGIYIYPNDKEEKYELMYINSGTTYENNVTKNEDISVIKLGLEIPKDIEDYKDFCVEIQRNEETFLKILENIFKKEKI